MGRIAGYDQKSRVKLLQRALEAHGLGHLWNLAKRDPFAAMNEFADNVQTMEDNAAGWQLACYSQWDITRGIYVFDSTLSDEIDSMDFSGFKAALLYSLPEKGLFIEFGQYYEDVQGILHGAFVAGIPLPTDETALYILAEVGKSDGSTKVRLAKIVFKNSDTISFSGLLEAGSKVIDTEGNTVPGDTRPLWLQRILSRALYLSSAEPDIRNPREPRNKPNRHVRNNGPVRHWEVGYRFGAAFRKQLAEAEQRASTGHGGDERNRPRVHVRRAHWHSFWTGPKEGERKLITKWLPPTIVNAEGGELPAVIWRQK